jgi:hypothetical protein
MHDPTPPMSKQQADDRRRGVRRTVLLFAAIAVAIYAGFILSGVVSSGVLGGGSAP